MKKNAWKRCALVAVLGAWMFGVVPMTGTEAAAHVALANADATGATNAMNATSTQASVPAAEAKAVVAPIEEATGLAETYAPTGRRRTSRWPSGNLAHFFHQII